MHLRGSIIIIIDIGFTALLDTECHSRVVSSYSESVTVKSRHGVWLS